MDELLNQSATRKKTEKRKKVKNEKPELLRQLQIQLNGFSIVTHLKHPKGKERCLSDMGEDENGLSKSILARRTNIHLLYEMPETILNGPMKGKLSPIGINMSAPILDVVLSNRQYGFIFEFQ